MVIAFGIFAVSVVLCLWAADFIGQDVALDSMKRAGLIIGVLGAALSAIFLLLSGRRSGAQAPRPPNAGPNF